MNSCTATRWHNEKAVVVAILMDDRKQSVSGIKQKQKLFTTSLLQCMLSILSLANSQHQPFEPAKPSLDDAKGEKVKNEISKLMTKHAYASLCYSNRLLTDSNQFHVTALTLAVDRHAHRSYFDCADRYTRI
nr:hypothetical protein Iba_chr02bCG18380 [Ipomoea batatas]